MAVAHLQLWVAAISLSSPDDCLDGGATIRKYRPWFSCNKRVLDISKDFCRLSKSIGHSLVKQENIRVFSLNFGSKSKRHADDAGDYARTSPTGWV
jgi:hypothetical protein